MDWIKSTVENEYLGLGCNGAFPIFRIRCDTPHIEFIIESYKDTFIEMKRTITQPKLSFLLPGTWAAADDDVPWPGLSIEQELSPRLWSWCMLAFLHTWLQITTIQGTGSEDHRGAQWRWKMWHLGQFCSSFCCFLAFMLQNSSRQYYQQAFQHCLSTLNRDVCPRNLEPSMAGALVSKDP